MSETLFARGTAEQGYGARRRVNAIGDQGGQGASTLQRFLQSQWEESMHGMGLRAIGRAIGATFTAADQATVSSIPGLESSQVAAAAVRGGASTEEAQQKGEQARSAAEARQAEDRRQTGMTPGLLTKYLAGVEYGWSNFVARPASTALLATDPDAPIYDDGFQLQDIRDSWDRSETVSFGRAFAASPLNEVITPANPLGAVARIAGFDNYDVWSDTDMEAADENPFYNFFTGSADAALQIMPLSLRSPRLSMLRKAGVRSQRGILSSDDLVTLRTEYDEHRAWRASQTAPTNMPDGDPNNFSFATRDFEAATTYGEKVYIVRPVDEPLDDPFLGNDPGTDFMSPNGFEVVGIADTEIPADQIGDLLYHGTDASLRPGAIISPLNTRQGATAAPDSAMPAGRETGIGFLVDNVARQTDPAKILESPLLTGVTGIDKVKLSNIYARTDDPDTVFTLYMAGKGDFQALQDLAERAPQHIWNLAEMDSVIYNNYLDGVPFQPRVGNELNLVNQIFDSPIDRDRYFLDVRRTFIDTEDGSPRMGDMTMANSLWVEKIRDANGQMRYAFKTGDYTGAPQWVRKIVESPVGGPTTQFIAWVGSRQPLGRVSRSGARPNDLIEELDAWFNSVPMFRGPKQQLKVGTDKDGNPVFVPAQQFVSEQKARLLQAQVDGNLEGAWREMENESIIVMGLTLGYDARAAADLINKADTLRGEAQAAVDYLQSTGGYLFAENQRVIYDSAATLSMLLDTFATTSLRDILYYAKQNLPEASKAGKFGTWLPRGSAQLFDEVMKFFRTNVLLDIGYIPKNSLGEPWVASGIAHGTILTDDGLSASIGNFSRNRANNLRRAAYASELSTRVKKLLGSKKDKTRKDLRIEINSLIIQREDALATIDLMQADLDAIKAGVVPPSQSPKVAARARATMFEAHKIIRSIEASLDNTIPEWRQVVEPATVAQVSERLRFYRAVLGEDPEYLNDLRDELGSIYTRSYESTTLPSQRLQKQIDDYNAQIAEIDKTLVKYSEDYNRPSVDKRDVSVALNQEDAIARGRDYRAIALQRQRRSLVEQRDEMIDEKLRIEQTGVDAFADFKMSVSDKARSDYLEQQIARLEALTDADNADAIRPLLDDLQEKYDGYLRSIDREVDASAEARDAMIKRVEELDEKLKAIQTQLGFKEAKLDGVRGDRVQFGAGRGTMTFNIGGEKFTVPGSLSDDQYALGAGWRSEVSAAQTTRMNYDPSFKAGSLTARLRDAGDVEVIDRFDPRYFDELAYVANTHFRSDQLIGQILEGKTKAEVAKWLRTPKGRQYQEALGKDYLTNVEVRSDPMPGLNSDSTVRMLLESASTLDEIWNIVYAYLPTDRVRKFVADRRTTGDFPLQGRGMGVTGAELKALLAGEENLSRILSARGVWETYGNSKSKLREVGAMYNRALDKLWGYAMTQPETLLARNPFFDREFRRQMETRIGVIEQQAKKRGLKMTVEQWNNQLQAIRQSARRDALAEMEKTFYNIRRYSTPVYAARFLTAFPGAVFNSLYRYGRFAWREPERMLVGSLALGDAISVLGVDAEGNPVGEENIGDAVYLLIPGTKKTAEDAGTTIPIGSVATMFVDLPQLSWLGNFAVSSIVSRNPKYDQRFRDAFDTVGLGWYYDDLFPFGPPSNPLSVLFGPYQKELRRWYGGLSDTDFIMSAVQFYANNMAQWEKNGYEGEAPTFEEAVEETHAYYFAETIQLGPLKLPKLINLDSRAVSKFMSPVSIKQTAPGQMMRDAWYRHREQYPNDTAEARKTFMEKHGPWARWYTFSSSEYTTYMPSSIDVFERVWEKYPNLVRRMNEVAGDDAIEYVNLLVLDADQTFDPNVNNYLRNNPLPGDDVPVLRRIQPERFANIVQVNDGWDLYSREVVKYEAELTRLREMRDNASSPEMQDFYRDEIYRTEQSWTTWLDTGPLSENIPWQVSRNDRGQDKADNAAAFLSMIVNDPDFSKDEGQSQFWKNVKFFIEERERAKSDLGKIRDDNEATAYKARFRAWVRFDFMPTTPEFLPTFERYFEKEWE